MSNVILKISGTFLAVFGMASLFMTTSILLNVDGFQQKHQNFIPFIVYINFFCSFLYLLAAYGFFTNNKWTTGVLFFAVAVLIAAYVAMIIHIQTGGAFEIRTVKVMLARVSLTILSAGISWFYLTRTKLIGL